MKKQNNLFLIKQLQNKRENNLFYFFAKTIVMYNKLKTSGIFFVVTEYTLIWKRNILLKLTLLQTL